MAETNLTGANIGFENKLWAAADKLRGHMDAAEYKHVVLGLVFLKYISDSFQERYEQLSLWTADPGHQFYVREEKARYTVLEDRDEYLSENIFWVPKEARWSVLQNGAKLPDIGRIVDDAMLAIEQANPSLKGVLPKDYARPTLNKQRLGELIDLIGSIGLGDRQSRSQDVLGRVYEYFLGQFAQAEGKRGGEFYTPQSIVRVLVEMIEPYKGRVYDPCCGSGGMFVQSERFVEAHGGSRFDLSVYGQESNPTTWRLCKMNLAIRGIEGNIGGHNADSFLNDLHADLRADFILANPPFNMSDWGGAQLQNDVRWRYGTPPANNANYAWIQHMIHHLAPNGRLGLVLANGSMSSNTSGEGAIRKAIVEADLVECMVALPGQLFYTTQIPVCLWFLSRGKGNGRHADRRGQTLFIDARQLGRLVDRTHRDFDDEDIRRIADTFRAWRGDPSAPAVGAGLVPARDGLVPAQGDPPAPAPVGAGLVPALDGLVPARDGLAPAQGDHEGRPYEDVPGFCYSATLDEIRGHDYVLTPGRYVGAAEVEDDGEPFEEKMARLVEELASEFSESNSLQGRIVEILDRLL